MRIRIWFFMTPRQEKRQELSTLEIRTGDSSGAAGEGTYYLANSKGIFVYKEDGSIVEQIYDAGRGVMGETASSLIFNHFLAGEKERLLRLVYRLCDSGAEYLLLLL